MKILRRTEQPETKTAEVFHFEEQLAAAGRAALEPLAERLRAYADEGTRLRADIERWSPDAYTRRLDALRNAALSNDPEAVKAVENGTLPSPAAFAAMENRAVREYELWHRSNCGLFREVLAALQPELMPVYEQAQSKLDAQLDALDVPRFVIHSARNRINYILGQVAIAGEPGNSADLTWLFEILQGS